MKSKTSFFDQATLRLDLTRFAPVWGLYTVMIISVIFLVMDYGAASANCAKVLARSIPVMALGNFFYALIAAQTLFGYLYDSRLCCGFHALPLTRGCHFRTHILSGLLFSLIPNLTASLLSVTLTRDCWIVSAWWLLGVSLQYLFFFGLAVVCCFCAGNRIGGVLCYGLANFLSLLVYGIANDLLRPLMYGVSISQEPFISLSPVCRMMIEKAVNVKMHLETATGAFVLDEISLEAYYYRYGAICAAVGVLLLFAAYGLYRRRALESAGELLAVKPLKPVFLTLFTLAAGIFFRLVFSIFLGSDESYLPLFIGIIVGYFVGRMLIERQVKVFQLSALPLLAAIIVVLLGSLALTSLDVLHITRRIPESEEIASVEISPITEFGSGPALTDRSAIEDIREIHSHQVKMWEDWRRAQGIGGLLTTTRDLPTGGYSGIWTEIRYTLKDGSILVRDYVVPVMASVGETHEASAVDGQQETVPEAKYRETRDGAILRKYLSTTENVLGITDAEIPAYAARLDGIWFSTDYGKQDYIADPQPLLEAIARDCKAGLMVPHGYLSETDSYLGSIHIEGSDRYNDNSQDTPIHYRDIPIYESRVNTARCLREMGLLAED